MNRTLVLYLSRLLLGRIALVLASFVALLQLFDLLNNAQDIIRMHGEGGAVLLRYTLLRMPQLVAFMLPFATLIGTLLALAKLARQSEVTATRAIGLSFRQIFLLLVPPLLLLAVVHALVSDQAAPAANRALTLWESESSQVIGAFDPPAPQTVWTRDGADMWQVRDVQDRGFELGGVTIYRRDREGNLLAQVMSPRAVYDDGQWVLSDVAIYEVDSAQPDIMPARQSEARLVLPASLLTPDNFIDASATPAGLPMSELLRLTINPGLGSFPDYVYAIWVHKRLALPLTVFVMALLAIPVAGGLQRSGGTISAFAIGVALGFGYFVVDGITLAMGQSGSIPPWLAAWSPILLFSCIGAWGLLQLDND
jgi:lipopolysaccharide export system permease protein